MNHRILYVEDEPFIAKTLSKVLSDQGYELVVENDGEAGLERALRERFDIILLDILLPKMDGFEVLRRLKESPDTKQVPVIVLSNLSSEQDKEKAHELGAHDFFVKVIMNPISIADHVKKLIGPGTPKDQGGGQ